MRSLDGITDSMDMSLNNSGNSRGQESLVCCSPWVCEKLDMTEQLNKPINPKGDQLSIFIRRTDSEAEAPILWPTDVKS